MSDLRRKKQVQNLQQQLAEQEALLRQQQPRHPLTWFRAFAGPAFAIGGWQIMALSCIAGIGLVFLGFAICLAEIVWEPELASKPYQFQVVLVAVVIVLVDLFVINVAFSHAPLVLGTLGARIGTTSSPGGIPWRPFYTELDVMMTNPTDGYYENIDMLVRPDLPVAAIAQLSNLSDVSFENKQGLNMKSYIEELAPTAPPPESLVLLATDDGYKVHCGRIPSHSTLTIVMAIVNIKKAPPAKTTTSLRPGEPITITGNPPMESFFIETDVGGRDGSFAYWYGNPNYTLHYGPKPTPQKVLVSGLYTANNCRHGITRDVSVQWSDNQ